MSNTQKTRVPERDPVGTFEHAVLALFEGPLSTVGFPGIDRAVLLEAVRTANEAQLVVEAAEHGLEHARRDLGDKTGDLAKLTRRAVAYARVLAEDDVALAEKLESLSPRTNEPARTTRKRRPRNESTAMLPLATDDASDDEIAAE